ncbi:MAG: FAD-dependent oxidoreductase [Oscillospiraceae bacterium]|nr:FAD-dependent oxidoreductase [Oscillospiraceae bacterium]
MSFNKYPNVFSPIRIGNMEVKNRIQFSPMVSSLSTPTGGVSPELLGYIKYQAQSGVGVITIGSTPIDHINGVDFFGALDVTSDDNITDLRRISEITHRYGVKISCELVHAGRSAPKCFRPNSPAIAPSAIPVENGPTDIREMNETDMEIVRNEYCDVAERLMKAGFDMVMVHAAHGNLLAQFMSPKYNRRTDEYGGSFENRVRWPLSVLKAMRERVGRGLCIDMRISGDELVPGGMGIEETKAFIRLAQEYIDTVHVSQGLIVEPRYMPYTMPAFYLPHCHNVKWSEQVKADPEIHIPVTVVGSITTIAEAEEIIASGKADMVAMARQLMCDNQLLHNAYRGEEEKTRPCLRCHECAPAEIVHLRCATNPRLGREFELGEIQPSRHPRKVVVVGGGVAGCMAAKTLVERGHEVILMEQGDKLGGRLHEISCLSFKFDMRRHLKWLMSSTMECGAKILLNTEATPEIILALKPDVVFIATGADRIAPPIPGLNRSNVHHVLDVDTGREAVGDTVVVCGGGLSGTESALQLAMEGKKVTVVDMLPVEQFARDHSPAPRGMLLQLLEQYGVKLIGSVRVCEIGDDGVAVQSMDGAKTVLPCDDVVAAFGMKKNDRLLKQMQELMPDVIAVGDCNVVKNIKNANQVAFNLALDL